MFNHWDLFWSRDDCTRGKGDDMVNAQCLQTGIYNMFMGNVDSIKTQSRLIVFPAF